MAARLVAGRGPDPRPLVAGLQVEATRISKRFGSATALDDVSIDIAAGSIHALVGENGAGKSTLGKVIAGAVTPDGGALVVDGKPVSYRSPRDAIRGGIAIIDQELVLVPSMSVLDNVFLGAERGRGIVDRRKQRQQFDELAARIGFRHEPSVAAGELRVADQQKVEIMRALVRDARLIVMDEPTAALTRTEADRLLELTRELRGDGATILYVSHILGDVLGLCDTVTVLKDGRHVKTTPTAGETTDSLVTAMLGRSVDLAFPPRAPRSPDSPVLLKVRGLTREPAFRDVSFDVHAGEIVGLAGLVGSGRSEIARAVFGADPSTGTIEMEGRPLRTRSPRGRIRRAIAMMPEDRKDQGLVMIRPVSENVSIVHLGDVCVASIISSRAEQTMVDGAMARVDVRAANRAMPMSALSGGNQQKVAFAKWLVKPPRLFIADEPTRGIDVGAKRAIYEMLHGLAAQGLGVLLISSELEEVIGLAHRVLVVRDGGIVAELDGAEATEELVMRAVFGSYVPDSPTVPGPGTT
jgi:ABC-type sugar transport system ATPase subunit